MPFLTAKANQTQQPTKEKQMPQPDEMQTIQFKPTETLHKALLLCTFPDGRETVNIQKSRRQAPDVIASAKALGCRTYAIKED